MVIKKIRGGEGIGGITRAIDAYSFWSTSSPTEPFAPDEYLLSATGQNDAQVIEHLKEHDPLSSDTSPLVIDDLAIDPDSVVLAELLVAGSIATQAGELGTNHDRKQRMEAFVLSRFHDIRQRVGLGEFGVEAVLGGLVADWSEAQRLLLLIEVASNNPFAPYEIAWYPDQEHAALAHVANVIGLSPDVAHDVTATFTEAASAHRQISVKRAGLFGLGAAAALGGVGFLASPALGAAVGTAAGLKGAAATSYGLGLLGSMGGATMPGTFTAGGVWLVAQAGASAGAFAGAAGSILYGLGAGAAQNEVIKLQVTYKMILVDMQRNDAAKLDVLTSLDERIMQVEWLLSDHLEISDPDSSEVKSLEDTIGMLRNADSWMQEQFGFIDEGNVHVQLNSFSERLSRIEAVLPTLGLGKKTDAGSEIREQFPAAALTQVEDRIRGRFTVKAELDRWDVIAAIAAGIAGAAADAVIVGTPSNSLTSRLRRTVSSSGGNWLEELAKVPYDQSMGDGFTPVNHRVLTPGHDPLLGLVVGTRDILTSTMTRSNAAGAVQFVDKPTVERSATLLSAVGTQVLHLFSDIVTPAGLPLPGWTALTTSPALAESAVKMYAKGYDTWHLAPMAVPIAAVHAVGAAYWAYEPMGNQAKTGEMRSLSSPSVLPRWAI